MGGDSPDVWGPFHTPPGTLARSPTPWGATRGVSEEESFSVAETARLINKTESGVRRMLERGDLRGARDSRGRLRVLAGDVERYRQRVQSLSKADLFGALERDARPPLVAPMPRRAPEEIDASGREELERTITTLRREVARLRGALESLLVADDAKRDAISQLLLEEEGWTR